jgi:hypothetical protein
MNKIFKEFHQAFHKNFKEKLQSLEESINSLEKLEQLKKNKETKKLLEEYEKYKKNIKDFYKENRKDIIRGFPEELRMKAGLQIERTRNMKFTEAINFAKKIYENKIIDFSIKNIEKCSEFEDKTDKYALYEITFQNKIATEAMKLLLDQINKIQGKTSIDIALSQKQNSLRKVARSKQDKFI